LIIVPLIYGRIVYIIDIHTDITANQPVFQSYSSTSS